MCRWMLSPGLNAPEGVTDLSVLLGVALELEREEQTVRSSIESWRKLL